MANTPSPSSELLNALLQNENPTAHALLLTEANLMHEEGLLRLLDAANEKMGQDPHQAERLAVICRQNGETLDASVVVPKADYLAAHSHAVQGNLTTARELLETAQAGFARLHRDTDLLRISVGLSTILGELGEYSEAISLCEETLEKVHEVDSKSAELQWESERESTLLVAKLNQNLGILNEKSGQFANALERYDVAETAFAQLDMDVERARVLVNRGLVSQQLGQFQAALQAFRQADELYIAEEQPLYQARVHINIGETFLLLCQYGQSMRALEHAQEILAGLNKLSDTPILMRHLGDAYLAVNLHDEADHVYKTALVSLRDAGLMHHYSCALWGLGMTLANHAPAQAFSLLAEAAENFEKMGDLRRLATVQLEQSQLFFEQGNSAEAQAQVASALTLTSQNGWRIEQIYALMRSADFSNSATEAQAYLDEADNLMRDFSLPQLRYRLDARLGKNHMDGGNAAAAFDYLERAIQSIERQRQTLLEERMRTSFLDDKMMAFETLIQLHLNNGDYQDALAVVERARSRALVDLLINSIEEESFVGISSPEVELGADGELTELRAELDVLYSQLLRGTDEVGDAAENIDEEADGRSDAIRFVQSSASETLSEQAATLERKVARILLESPPQQSMIYSSNGGNLPQINSELLASFFTNDFDVQEILDGLAVDFPVVIYQTIESEIMAFVYTNGDFHVFRNLGSTADVQVHLQNLANQWDRFRAGSDFVARHGKMLERTTARTLQTLYHQLFEPIEHLLTNDAEENRLLVIPHGMLHQLPFHALYDGLHYLVDRYAISYAPSLLVYSMTRQRQNEQKRARVFGIADEQIPDAIEEATSISQMLHQRGYDVDLLLENKGTVESLREASENCGLLHMACHGIFRSDNPFFSALKLHNGWLTAADALHLSLDGAIVVLSACESGRSRIMGGDELTGMCYGMFGGGASSLLASQWIAQDNITAQLMKTWYEQLQHTDDLAEALRLSQLCIKRRYSHPYYWAPFMLLGSRQNSIK